MPCTYALYPDLATLHCRFSGRFNMRDALNMIERAGAEPRHEDGTNVIADFLDVTRFDIDINSQWRMFRYLAALEDWPGLPRSCALIADGEPVWAMAGTIVDQTTLESPLVFERFLAPSPALRFVGLDPNRHGGRFGYGPVH